MRPKRPAPALWLALAGGGLLSVSGLSTLQAQPAAALLERPPLKIALDDPLVEGEDDGTIGIVCDNLAGMAPARRNYLLVRLPAVARAADIRLELEDGAQTGTLAATQDPSVWRYEPPAAWNERFTAARLIARDSSGVNVSVAPARILLERPSVVLVHGINNTPRIWSKENALGAVLQRKGWDVKAVDHGADDLEQGRVTSEAPGALAFRGNGPVEWGADQLGKSIAQALAARRAAHFAARRVDVVAYSYGSVISRWYLHEATGCREHADSARWYVHSSNHPAPPDLYKLHPSLYSPGQNGEHSPLALEPGVRKLITLAGIWRGVPAANLVNEVQGAAGEPYSLADARFAGRPLSWHVRQLQTRFPLPTQVPAMEVLAVESRWLEHLNRKPFLEEVAYEAIAGNNNAFLLDRVDAYAALDRLMPNGWFPYLTLEERHGAAENYSDGIVPVWSAVFAGRERVVNATHKNIVHHPGAVAEVLRALDDPELPTGSTLNQEWDRERVITLGERVAQSGAVAGKILKRWRLPPGAMAPEIQSHVYRQVNGVGRVNPRALREIASATAVPLESGSSRRRIQWQTAVPCRGEVFFYKRVRDPGTGMTYHRLIERKVTSTGKAENHEVVIDTAGLEKSHRYVFVVKSYLEDGQNLDIILESRPQPLR